MRGNSLDLQDIVLNELPENVDLHCYEVLQDEEEEQQVHQPMGRDAFEVAICCGICHRPIKFVCFASISTLQQLESLLFGSLDFVCHPCVRDNRLNHGG